MRFLKGFPLRGPVQNGYGVGKGLLNTICDGHFYMGGCQNYGPSLGPDYNTAPII